MNTPPVTPLLAVVPDSVLPAAVQAAMRKKRFEPAPFVERPPAVRSPQAAGAPAVAAVIVTVADMQVAAAMADE